MIETTELSVMENWYLLRLSLFDEHQTCPESDQWSQVEEELQLNAYDLEVQLVLDAALSSLSGGLDVLMAPHSTKTLKQ